MGIGIVCSWFAMTELKGQILIASSRLMDPNFIHTVLLIVQHGEDGALGLVLNRPSDTPVQEACAEVLEESVTVAGLLYEGGPCEGPLMAIHTHKSAAEIPVLDGVYFTTDRAKLQTLLANDQPHTRFFAGYAGWSPGQLEKEMEIGSWLALPANVGTIFSEDPALWTKLIQSAIAGRWIDPADQPDDPSVN